MMIMFEITAFLFLLAFCGGIVVMSYMGILVFKDWLKERKETNEID